MTEELLAELLGAVRTGGLEVADALERLRGFPVDVSVAGARVDTHRKLRTGAAEVVFCPGKTPDQVAAILSRLHAHHGRALGTRATPELARQVGERLPAAAYDPVSRLLTLGWRPPGGRSAAGAEERPGAGAGVAADWPDRDAARGTPVAKGAPVTHGAGDGGTPGVPGRVAQQGRAPNKADGGGTPGGPGRVAQQGRAPHEAGDASTPGGPGRVAQQGRAPHEAGDGSTPGGPGRVAQQGRAPREAGDGSTPGGPGRVVQQGRAPREAGDGSMPGGPGRVVQQGCATREADGGQSAPAAGALVAVVTGGTSDLPVAEEAAQTLEFLGGRVERCYDVGVAGLHRLLAVRPQLERAAVVICVAGMEGALTSVVGGLLAAPVIGVPTSVGYGAHFGGTAPLLAMLNSCAAGVAVVNIDNGFGAALMAHAIIRQIDAAAADSTPTSRRPSQGGAVAAVRVSDRRSASPVQECGDSAGSASRPQSPGGQPPAAAVVHPPDRDAAAAGTS